MENLKSLDYQFTAVPTQLMILLDVNCRSMLFTLCQLASYYTDKNGRFFRTNADLAEESNLSQKLVIATIDTLYRNGIVYVWSVGKGKGKHSNYFQLNTDRFKDFEELSMDDLKNPENKIEMVNYRDKGYSPLYLRDGNTAVPLSNKQKTQQDVTSTLSEHTQFIITEIPPTISQNTNNINNIENTENEDNINNENNKEENIINSREEIEEKWKEIMLERLGNGETVEYILEDFAKNDWDCYQFCKQTIRNGNFQFYEGLRSFLRILNRKYGPEGEYFDVA